MLKKRWLWAMVITLLLILSACGVRELEILSQTVRLQRDKPQVKEPKELIIFAAASLVDVMNEIKVKYEKKNPDVTLLFNYASSGALQKQIEEGAPVDLFISAGVSQMEELHKKGFILEAYRINLLGNKLVLIGTPEAKKMIHEMTDLTKPEIRSISIGTPETVPAGGYAKESLVNYQLWEVLKDKYIFAKDVKQVLTYVDTLNADVGFAYMTDVRQMKYGEMLFELDDKAYERILYPVAITKSVVQRDAAEDFFRYLQQDESKAVFKRLGFYYEGSLP